MGCSVCGNMGIYKKPHMLLSPVLLVKNLGILEMCFRVSKKLSLSYIIREEI